MAIKNTFFSLCFFLLVFVSCSKKDEPKALSFIGKWNYDGIVARNFEGSTLLEEEPIFHNSTSFIEFNQDSTYAYDLTLSTGRFQKAGTWEYDSLRTLIIFDANIDSSKNWRIESLSENQMKAIATDYLGNNRFENEFNLKR